MIAYAGAGRPSQQTTRTHAKSKLSLGEDGHAVARSASQPADLIPEELPAAPGIQIQAIDAADQPSIAIAKQSHGLSHAWALQTQQLFSDNGRLTKRIRFRLESRAQTYSKFSIKA